MKKSNEYAAAFAKLYDVTPKAVFAAIAWSLANRIGGNEVHTVMQEWNILHLNGIVPQPAPRIAGEFWLER